MRLRLCAAVASLIVASPITAGAAEMHTVGQAISISGEIVANDVALFEAMVAGADARGQPVRSVVLNSPGGLVLGGMRIADTVHTRHLDAIVPGGARCASSCFLIFAAGGHRLVGEDAQIGVHSATRSRSQGIDDGDGTILMARYAARLGVPAAIIGRMVETESASITWLNANDLHSMNVETLRPPAEPAPAPAPPKPAANGFMTWAFGGAVPDASRPKVYTSNPRTNLTFLKGSN